MSKFVPITITEEQKTALESTHGDVMVVQGPERSPWLCVLRRPSTDEAAAYVAMANDTQKKTHAPVKLVTALCVYPPKDSEEWRKQYSTFPLFPFDVFSAGFVQEFLGLSGAREAIEK